MGAVVPAGNHEEESEIQYGDDITQITGCSFPGSDGSTPDCARAFVCGSQPAFGLRSVVSFAAARQAPVRSVARSVCRSVRLHCPPGHSERKLLISYA